MLFRSSNLFIGAYLYDTDGTAVWYTSIGTISGSVFSGNLVEYQSGQTLSGTYRAPEVRRTIGTVSITFSSSLRSARRCGSDVAVAITR